MSKKNPSRPERWAEACSKIRDGLEALQELKGEYEEWKDGLPDNLQSGSLADKLEEVCNFDLDSIETTLDEAEGIDLPRGFGRD